MYIFTVNIGWPYKFEEMSQIVLALPQVMSDKTERLFFKFCDLLYFIDMHGLNLVWAEKMKDI